MTVGREPELAGQTVAVIGGSSGIGLETARRAMSEGADAILIGRNQDRLDRAAQELGASGRPPSTRPTRMRWRRSSAGCRRRSTM